MTAESPRLDSRGVVERPQSLIPLYGFCAYFLFKPFYFFPAGTPQIADFAMVGLAAALLVVGTDQQSARSSRVLIFASLFIVYAMVVNVVYALQLASTEFIKAQVFMFFNLGIFFLGLALADRYGDLFFRSTLIAVAASLLLQVLLSLVVDSGRRRQTVFFDNPNQLGYWTLLSVSIFFVCSLRVSVHWVLRVVVCCAGLYLVALSLSKAAMFATIVLFVLAFVTQPRQLLAAIPIGIVLFVAMSGSELSENVTHRIGAIGQERDSSLGERGYALLWRFPEYLVLGAGHGDFHRFYAQHVRELHSTLGSILFAYGIVGLSLFGLFMYGIYREAGLYRFAFLGPAFLYGVTHQGIRFSVFWALFAITASSRAAEPETPPRGVGAETQTPMGVISS